MYVMTGQYNDYLTLVDARWAGGSIIGVSDTALTAAPKGTVQFTNAANTHLYIGVDGFTIRNISSTGITDNTKIAMTVAANSATLDNIGIYDTAGRYMALTGTGANISHFEFKGSDKDIAVNIAVGGAGTFSYGKILPSNTKSAATSTAVKHGSSGTINLFNVDVHGSDDTGVSCEGTGILNVTNCIIGTWGGASYPIKRTSGTVNLTTSLVIPSWGSQYTTSGTIVDGGGNIYDASPRFRRHARQSYLALSSDDVTDTAETLQYAADVGALLRARGLQGTLFVTGHNLIYENDYSSAFLSVLANNSWEVAVHGLTHMPYDLTSFGTITKGAETFTVNRAADTITTSDESVTITGFRTKIMGDANGLVANSIAKAFVDGGWTVTYADEVALNNGAYNHGEILADGVATNALDLLIDIEHTGADITGYFKDQVWDFKAYLAEHYGEWFVSTIIAPPGGRTNATVNQALINMGFTGSRIFGSVAPLTNYDVYLSNTIDTDTISDSTPARDSMALAEFMASYGTFVTLLSHNSEEYSTASIATILDTFRQYSEVSLVPFSSAIAAIRATTDNGSVPCTDSETPELCCTGAGTGTCEGIFYTRTWTDASDYRLRPGSPAINAGTDVSLTTDYLGKPVRGTPDVGAYEFQPMSGNFSFGFGIGF
jgi:peptidoglycan/xylan/chitin deacetylase (PgdA/CDA1 family)